MVDMLKSNMIQKRKKNCFLKSFTKGFIFNILYLGYYSKSQSHNDKFCDWWSCNNFSTNDGLVLNCDHAYHT